MSTPIHEGMALPSWQRWCTLLRWTRARAQIHLAGSHLCEPGGPASQAPAFCFFTERFEAYTPRHFLERYSQIMPDSHIHPRGNRFADTVRTRAILPKSAFCAKCLIVLAPRAGFEPATIRLTVECSTAELPRNRRNDVRTRAAYNKASGPCKGRNGPSRRNPCRARKPAAG
jgi:hypothetical protein